MFPRRFTFALALAFTALGVVLLAGGILAARAETKRQLRAADIAASQAEVQEILSKADQDLQGDVEIVVRRRIEASDFNRGPDCANRFKDRRVFLRRARNGTVESTTGLTWPMNSQSSVRLIVPSGAACLQQPAEALGVREIYSGGEFIVAYIQPQDRDSWWRIAMLGLGLFLVFAMLAALVEWMFNANLMRQVRQINQVLDQMETSGFTVRVQTEGMAAELGELSNNINAMIRRMGDFNANMSRLSIHIAHDLRSPLAVLRKRLDRLKGEIDGTSSENLNNVRNQVDALLHRCTQLLEIVRIETESESSFATVELRDKLNTLVDDIYSYLAEEKGNCIKVDAPEPIEVAGGDVIIERMFSNLLDNAVKFATPRSTITITLASINGQAFVTFENVGPVVPNERLDTIFDPNTASPISSGGGYGLGLPFVRAAARRHGGDAIAQPTERGMRFIVGLGTGRLHSDAPK